MAQVSVTINGRKYQIACDDGQEAHLSRLGSYIDKRIGELVAAVGQVGDARLLVMASLLIADELSDAYAELKALGKDERGAAGLGAAEEAMAERIETLASRIEDIAARLEES
jgi:cell division protein ZapA